MRNPEAQLLVLTQKGVSFLQLYTYAYITMLLIAMSPAATCHLRLSKSSGLRHPSLQVPSPVLIDSYTYVSSPFLAAIFTRLWSRAHSRFRLCALIRSCHRVLLLMHDHHIRGTQERCSTLIRRLTNRLLQRSLCTTPFHGNFHLIKKAHHSRLS